jgi:hypothetical protein
MSVDATTVQPNPTFDQPPPSKQVAGPAPRVDAARPAHGFDNGPVEDDADEIDAGRGTGLLLVVGLFALLAGLGGFWLLTRGSDDDQSVATDDTTENSSENPAGASISETGEVADSATQLGAAETGVEGADTGQTYTEPTLLFPAADGPLERFTTYEIELAAAPEEALLQVVVDGILQGTPAETLPNLILPEGRHTIEISMLEGEVETGRSNPVEIYVYGDEPPAGYTANLSSVNIADEGWSEALRRYDVFREAGHDNAMLLPLVDGYWNILVPGFGSDVGAVEAYCGSFNLAFPDDCFARNYTAGDYTAKADPRPAPEPTDSDAGTEEPAEAEAGTDNPADTAEPSTDATDGAETDGSMSDTEADGG